jgi:hypothetical protein
LPSTKPSVRLQQFDQTLVRQPLDAVIVAPKVEATSSRFFCLPNAARSRVYVLVDKRIDHCFLGRLNNRIKDGSRRSFGIVSTECIGAFESAAPGFASLRSPQGPF